MTDAPLVTVPHDRWLDLWPGDAPVRLQLWPMDASTHLRPEVVVLPYMGGRAGLPLLAELGPTLRLVQTLTAGFENVLPWLPDGVTLANATGVHDSSTAELALGLTIAALRGLGDFARAQPDGVWLAGTRPALADRRVMVVGAGSIGAAIADRFAPFEVSLTRVASHARDDDRGHVHGIDEVHDLLPHHDVVVLVVPLTEATRGLVDARFLAAMPDGALLVNVARGGVVVTDDLVTEVRRGRLLAALDVTDPEPLPADHPLWQAPGVLISPHVGGDTSAFPRRARALLTDQLTRYATGAPLRNVVAGPGAPTRPPHEDVTCA